MTDCNHCKLSKNQKPLTEKHQEHCSVMVVGLSAVKSNDILSDIPLSNKTRSGKIISRLEDALKQKIYRTNLVKCLPLDYFGKLRYPFHEEMYACSIHLDDEIKIIKPKHILLLGDMVAKFLVPDIKRPRYIPLESHGHRLPSAGDDVNIYAVHHPSYISRKGTVDEYVIKIIEAITGAPNE